MNIFHIQEIFSNGRGRVMNFSGGRTRAGDKTFWTGGHGRVSLKFVGRVRARDENFLRTGAGRVTRSASLVKNTMREKRIQTQRFG